jgi:transcriptional regulator with XRE-family HTH domain
MNEPKSQPAPFTALGTHLKYLRQQQQETLAEVSGAVEIGIDNLERIEQGIERPSEDILLLMISHFGIPDNEAGQLWELAGYDQPATAGHHSDHDQADGVMHEFKAGGKQMLMVLALDMRTLYSDDIEITITDAGVVLNFNQIGGQGQAGAAPVARVGMSTNQARKVLHSLEQALLKSEYLQGPKQLQAGNQKDAETRTTRRTGAPRVQKSTDTESSKNGNNGKNAQNTKNNNNSRKSKEI